MTRRRAIALGLAAAVLVAAAAAWTGRSAISLAIAERIATARMSADPIAALPDGLHVGLCGAGSPFPDERRSGPCTLVVAGQRMLVFDAGAGAVRNLGRMGFDPGRVDAVFVTHFHSDHIDGLGELMLQRWVAGANAAPVPVHGPRGVEQVVRGLMLAYAQDRHYRVAHHGTATVPETGFGGEPRPFDTGAGRRTVVLADGDLEVVAFEVDHRPVHPATGYRIRYRDRTVVLSGDTVATDAVRREAEGVDLLVHDALSPRLLSVLDAAAARAGRANLRKVFADIVDYHATPEDAARIARDAKVGFLLLNHVAPPLPPLPGLEEVFVGDARRIFAGPVRVGVDGDFLSLPAGSRRIDAGRRF